MRHSNAAAAANHPLEFKKIVVFAKKYKQAKTLSFQSVCPFWAALE